MIAKQFGLNFRLSIKLGNGIILAEDEFNKMKEGFVNGCK